MFRYELGMIPLLCFHLPFCLTIKLISQSPFPVTFACPNVFLSYISFHTPWQYEEQMPALKESLSHSSMGTCCMLVQCRCSLSNRILFEDSLWVQRLQPERILTCVTKKMTKAATHDAVPTRPLGLTALYAFPPPVMTCTINNSVHIQFVTDSQAPIRPLPIHQF